MGLDAVFPKVLKGWSRKIMLAVSLFHYMRSKSVNNIMSKGKQIFEQLNREGLAATQERKRKATEAAQRSSQKDTESERSSQLVKLTEFLRIKSLKNSQRPRIGSESSRQYSTDSPPDSRYSREQKLKSSIFDDKLEALKSFVKQNINSSKNFDIFLTMLNQMNQIAIETYMKPSTSQVATNQKTQLSPQNTKKNQSVSQYSLSTPSSPARLGSMLKIQQCLNEEEMTISQYKAKQ